MVAVNSSGMGALVSIAVHTSAKNNVIVYL
jgi:hypothetical protein